MDYIASLIDCLVAQGVPANRIVLGGFSQGGSMALLTGLMSKYAGKLAGLVGLSGYLPLADQIGELRKEAGLTERVEDEVQVFLVRRTGHMLVPKWYFHLYEEKLRVIGVKDEMLETKQYEGMAHGMGGTELRDLCTWLERVVPPVE